MENILGNKFKTLEDLLVFKKIQEEVSNVVENHEHHDIDHYDDYNNEGFKKFYIPTSLLKTTSPNTLKKLVLKYGEFSNPEMYYLSNESYKEDWVFISGLGDSVYEGIKYKSISIIEVHYYYNMNQGVIL